MPDKSVSTSSSERAAPSILVDEPILSMVATCLRTASRSGDMLDNDRHAPLNSSISPTKRNTSSVGRKPSRFIGQICQPII